MAQLVPGETVSSHFGGLMAASYYTHLLQITVPEHVASDPGVLDSPVALTWADVDS